METNLATKNGSNGTKGGSATGATGARVMNNFHELADFLWSIAELLRGDYKQADYGKVILPMTVLRRLDCVLSDTKEKVLAEYQKQKGGKVQNLDRILNRITKVPFHNVSKLSFENLRGDPSRIAEHLTSYINGFSKNMREIFIERFRFADHIQKLDDSNLLYQVVGRFAEIDLHPRKVSNHMMGLAFEELIRRFSEQSNETAGEHFTPREVIRLMVDLLFYDDDEALRRPGVVRSVYDPAAGTGGMLSVAEEYLRELNPDARLEVYGQELNDESFAICKADMAIKGQDLEEIKAGNSFSEDGHVGKKFDYMLSNPPFGVEWKKVEKVIRDEYETQGHAGRFGPGLPRISDGSTLFLLHMLSKRKQVGEGGSRLAIVFNASPLYSGDAGSGESEIRKWIIENDLLEAIIGLPDQLFYNTPIFTYVWVVTNRKPSERKGKIQLIDATKLFAKMKRSLGNKRHELSPENIAAIVRTYGDFTDSDSSKIFENADFGYRRIVVERPLRMNFQATPDRLARLTGTAAFQGLARSKKKGKAGQEEAESGKQIQARILDALGGLGSETWRNRVAFEAKVDSALARVGPIPKPTRAAIISALGDRDPSAEICRDERGNAEPDVELRDYENVPLKEDINAYFEREVKRYAPDAWSDESKTKIGYEIPFTRHFYKYAPLPALERIEQEMKAVESEIERMLVEATR
jgi:type I restriction enzyme M protein